MTLTTANPSSSAPIISTVSHHTAASPLNRHLWQNPFFNRDAVHLRHSRTPGAFARRTLVLLAFAILFTIFVYVIYIAPDWLKDQAIYVSGTAVVFAAFISMVSLPILDAAAARAGMNTVNYDLVLDVDDFAAMSETERREYVRGRHGLAQVMVWRLAMLFTGLRLVIVVMLLMQLAELSQPADRTFLPLFVRAAHDPSSFMLLVAATVPLMACFILEPLWRLRLMTVWGMRIALISRSRWHEIARLTVIGLGYWIVTGAFYLLGHHLFITEVFPSYFGFYYGGYGPNTLAQLATSSTIDPALQRLFLPFNDPAMLLFAAAVVYSLFITASHELGTRSMRHGCELKLADAENVSRRRTQLMPFARDIDPPYALPNLRVRLMRAVTPPPSLWKHPAFVMDARGMRRGRTRHDLASFTRLQVLRSLVAVGLIALFWTLTRWDHYHYLPRYNPSYYSFPLNILKSYLSDLSVVILLISLSLSLYMDVASMLSGLNTINADMVAGRWDTMRITAVPESDLIRIKHGVTQLRTWRAFVTLITLRLTAVTMLFILLCLEFNNTSNGYNWLRNLVIDSLRSPGNFMLALFWIMLLLGVFLIEPIIRLRTVSMIGVANSVGRDTIRALMTGFASVIGFWISQVALTALLVYGFQLFQNLIIRILVGDPNSYQVYSQLLNNSVWITFLIFAYILMPPLFLLIHYQNYRLMSWFSHRRVMRQAFDT